MINIRKLETELWEAADLLRVDSKVTSQEYCISVMIRALLWANLPESYSDNEIAIYKHTLYEYVYNTYPAA